MLFEIKLPIRPTTELRNILCYCTELTMIEKADLLIFNVNKETFFTKDFMESKSPNTPFLDKTLKGSVEFVLVGNEVLLDRI